MRTNKHGIGFVCGGDPRRHTARGFIPDWRAVSGSEIRPKQRISRAPGNALYRPGAGRSKLRPVLIKNLSASFLFMAVPFGLFASPVEDRKIEHAAGASYNYRTVLEDRVIVKVDDGIV